MFSGDLPDAARTTSIGEQFLLGCTRPEQDSQVPDRTGVEGVAHSKFIDIDKHPCW